VTIHYSCSHALFMAAALISASPCARSADNVFEVQVVTNVSRQGGDGAPPFEVAPYFELGLRDGFSAFVSGYADEEFQSLTLGLARAYGDLQLGLGLGQARFDGMAHDVINPWAYFEDDKYRGYFHYERYRNEDSQSYFMKAHAVRQFGPISLGVHYDSDLGTGPRVEANLSDQLQLWGVVPVSNRPESDDVLVMIGLTVRLP
jgi:hypothetical protein